MWVCVTERCFRGALHLPDACGLCYQMRGHGSNHEEVILQSCWYCHCSSSLSELRPHMCEIVSATGHIGTRACDRAGVHLRINARRMTHLFSVAGRRGVHHAGAPRRQRLAARLLAEDRVGVYHWRPQPLQPLLRRPRLRAGLACAAAFGCRRAIAVALHRAVARVHAGVHGRQQPAVCRQRLRAFCPGLCCRATPSGGGGGGPSVVQAAALPMPCCSRKRGHGAGRSTAPGKRHPGGILVRGILEDAVHAGAIRGRRGTRRVRRGCRRRALRCRIPHRCAWSRAAVRRQRPPAFAAAHHCSV